MVLLTASLRYCRLDISVFSSQKRCPDWSEVSISLTKNFVALYPVWFQGSFAENLAFLLEALKKGMFLCDIIVTTFLAPGPYSPVQTFLPHRNTRAYWVRKLFPMSWYILWINLHILLEGALWICFWPLIVVLCSIGRSANRGSSFKWPKWTK